MRILNTTVNQAGSHGEEFCMGFLSVYNNAKWQPNTKIFLCELRSRWGKRGCVNNIFYASWLNQKEETTCKKKKSFLNLDFSLQILLWMKQKLLYFLPEALPLKKFHIIQGKCFFLSWGNFDYEKSQRFTFPCQLSKCDTLLDAVAHVCNFSTQDSRAGWSTIQG